jgi:hypothetical protein
MEAALTRQRQGELFFSTIVEGPYDWKVRPVAEIAYDCVIGQRETSSVLIGAIWQIREDTALDFGIREGRTNNIGFTEIRVGVTYSLPLWRPARDR